MTQDFAFAVRTLRRRPGFTITALATLAFGIGAATAMFTVVNGVLLRPLPYRDPSQLVSIFTTFPYFKERPVVGVEWNRLRTPYPDYLNLVASQRSFEGVAGYMIGSASLALPDRSISITAGYGTANLLPLLGTPLELGRWFLPGEDGPGASHLAVLSHDLWRDRFGGDSAIVGRTVRVNEEPYVIIGILPHSFPLTGAFVERPGAFTADLWLPFGVSPRALTPGNHTMELVARLKPGVLVPAALADAEPLLRGGRDASRRGAAIVPRAEVETSAVQRPLLLLFGSVGVLLLITCGNIALLFLSECTVREPELRTRAALGAGRGRLVRLLLVESAVLATVGAAAGVVLGWWGTRVMVALSPTTLPHTEMVRLDVRVCLFAVVVAALVALASGLAPAIGLTRADPSRGTQGRVAAGRSRGQASVIAVQVCLSIVLMTGAALLARSVANEQNVRPGFRTDHLLALRIELSSGSDNDEVARIIARVPGVVHVTSAMQVPLSGRTNGQGVSVPPEIKLGAPGSSEAEHAIVAPNYFEILHIPLLAGRVFTEHDVDGAPAVAIVSESFARRFWPGETAIDRQFRTPNGVVTVVGVAGNVKNKTLDRDGEALFYRPLAQEGPQPGFLVETRGEPLALATAVERAVWSAAPGATISEVTSIEDLMGRALAPARYRALLAGIFAGVALLLTAVGLAGLTARGVASRLRELCIRMALGATPLNALRLAMLGGLRAVAVGLVVGEVLTLISARLLSEYLYGVSGRDAATYAVTALVALAACGLATAAATKRLRDADLSKVLRSE